MSKDSNIRQNDRDEMTFALINDDTRAPLYSSCGYSDIEQLKHILTSFCFRRCSFSCRSFLICSRRAFLRSNSALRSDIFAVYPDVLFVFRRLLLQKKEKHSRDGRPQKQADITSVLPLT